MRTTQQMSITLVSYCDSLRTFPTRHPQGHGLEGAIVDSGGCC